MNGATCIHGATYLDYTYKCREGTGNICESQYSPCMNGATCVHGATYLDYTCERREGKGSISVRVSAVLV